MTTHRIVFLTVSASIVAGVLGLLVLLFMVGDLPFSRDVTPASPVPQAEAQPPEAAPVSPGDASGATPVYRADFMAPPGAEWSHRKIGKTPKDQRPYLGGFVEQPVTLSLTPLPPHKLLRITFDLCLMGSWDGSSKAFGEKIWDLNLLDGRSLIHTTFGNCGFFTDNNEQAFPDSYPCRPHPAWTGSAEHGTLGTTQSWGGPSRTWDVSSVYHFELTFPHAEENATFEFKATMRGGKDKNYGLANVQVDVLPEWATPSDPESAELWKTLGEADPERFFKAQWDLVAAGDTAVDYIAGHLSEAINLPEPKLDTLIRELASADDEQAKPLRDKLVGQGRAAQANIASALDDDTIPAAGKPRLTSIERTVATYPETATELRLHRARQLLLAIHTPAAQALAARISADHSALGGTGASPTGEAFAAGGEGDWQKASRLYQDRVASGRLSVYGWSYVTAAALAAGETNACLKLCQQFMSRFGAQNDRTAAERCARACLSVPWISGELLQKALERADFCVASGGDNRWRQLAKGMAEYRRGHWAEALQWLREPERSSNLEVSSLAWPFSAMAHQQLGDTAAARQGLEEVNRRLKAVIETGELSDLRYKSFDNYARAFAVRVEAVRLILGQETTAAVEPNAVAEGRKRWQPILRLLKAGEQLSKQKQWTEAAEAFAQALQQPGFAWDLWELKQKLPSDWLPAAALLAGDETRHLELCQRLLDRTNVTLTPAVLQGYAGACLARTIHLPPAVKDRALALARRACEHPELKETPEGQLLQGMIEYREGRYNDAFSRLERAAQISRPITRARAQAFCGLASFRLGRAEDARQALRDAEQVLSAGPDGETGWWGLGLCEVALRELRDLLAAQDESKPARG